MSFRIHSIKVSLKQSEVTSTVSCKTDFPPTKRTKNEQAKVGYDRILRESPSWPRNFLPPPTFLSKFSKYVFNTGLWSILRPAFLKVVGS